MYERDKVLEWLYEHVTTDSLRKHCLAVEAGMIAYAKHFDEPLDKWSAVGLLHDLDYEAHPEVHPQKALEWLVEKGYEADFIQAVKGHGLEEASSRPTKLAKTLYAVDELASFIIAVALMRPTQLEGMAAKSVVKKMKDKAFAKAVDREGIKQAAQELGVDLNEHINRVIEGLQSHQAFLETRGESLL